MRQGSLALERGSGVKHWKGIWEFSTGKGFGGLALERGLGEGRGGGGGGQARGGEGLRRLHGRILSFFELFATSYLS